MAREVVESGETARGTRLILSSIESPMRLFSGVDKDTPAKQYYNMATGSRDGWLEDLFDATGFDCRKVPELDDQGQGTGRFIYPTDDKTKSPNLVVTVDYIEQYIIARGEYDNQGNEITPPQLDGEHGNVVLNPRNEAGISEAETFRENIRDYFLVTTRRISRSSDNPLSRGPFRPTTDDAPAFMPEGEI